MLMLIMRVLTIMMQRDAVKLLKRIRRLGARRREPAVQRHTLDPPFCPGHGPGPANVDALALLDVAEIDRVDAPALVRDDGRLHVPDQCPLRRAEEGVRLDVGRAGAGAEAAVFVFDEEFAD